jgi:hypothetical protein
VGGGLLHGEQAAEGVADQQRILQRQGVTHCPEVGQEGVQGVVGGSRRGAVAALVVGDDPKVRGQQWRDTVPGSLGGATAVEQHGRGGVATGVTHGKPHTTAGDRLFVPSHASEFLTAWIYKEDATPSAGCDPLEGYEPHSGYVRRHSR